MFSFVVMDSLNDNIYRNNLSPVLYLLHLEMLPNLYVRDLFRVADMAGNGLTLSCV